MGKPLSWKWKLLIVFVLACFGLMVYAFTDWGFGHFRDSITKGYEETPESERRDSVYADRYLMLAYWRGFICQDSHGAMDIYRDFLGMNKDPKTGQTVFESGQLVGKCSPDGKTGWGPMHPLAVEAFWNYLQLYGPLNSSGFEAEENKKYYKLLYEFPILHGKQPHPQFKKYWEKVKLTIRKHRHHVEDPDAPQAPAVEAAE